MRNEIMRMVLWAHSDREGVIAYANQEDVRDWPHPEIHAAVIEILDAAARFPSAVRVERSREKSKAKVPGQLRQDRMKILRKALRGPLEEGWRVSVPEMLESERFDFDDGKVEAWILGLHTGLGLPARINNDALKHWPECLIVVGLWRLLELVGSGLSILSVKRCAGCSRFFLDGSRGQRGKYCGGTCRVRAFRGTS